MCPRATARLAVLRASQELPRSPAVCAAPQTAAPGVATSRRCGAAPPIAYPVQTCQTDTAPRLPTHRAGLLTRLTPMSGSTVETPEMFKKRMSEVGVTAHLSVICHVRSVPDRRQ